MAAILAQNLSRKFGNDKTVFNDVSFEINHGECVALTGANGSGKTTLLRVLATLTLPTSGDAKVYGHSVSKESGAVRRYVTWAPATDSGFYPKLSGRENLEFFASLQGVGLSRLNFLLGGWSKNEPFKEALRKPFNECSTGMRHILALARVFLADPLMIFLDEPTRSLDRESAAFVREFLRAEVGLRTILFATHDDRDIMSVAHRTLRMEGGTVRC